MVIAAFDALSDPAPKLVLFLDDNRAAIAAPATALPPAPLATIIVPAVVGLTGVNADAAWANLDALR